MRHELGSHATVVKYIPTNASLTFVVSKIREGCSLSAYTVNRWGTPSTDRSSVRHGSS